MKKILAFSGSSSSNSINQQLVRMAATQAATAEVTVIDIRDFPLPVYSIDIEEADGFPDDAHKLKALFSEHDGFLISSPEHNGSMPAIFKNLIDWLSRMGGKIFQDKPVLLMSASPGGGGGRTNLANVETLMPWWGGQVVGTFSVGDFHNEFDFENLRFKNDDRQHDLTAAVLKLHSEVQGAKRTVDA